MNESDKRERLLSRRIIIISNQQAKHVLMFLSLSFLLTILSQSSKCSSVQLAVVSRFLSKHWIYSILCRIRNSVCGTIFVVFINSMRRRPPLQRLRYTICEQKTITVRFDLYLFSEHYLLRTRYITTITVHIQMAAAMVSQHRTRQRYNDIGKRCALRSIRIKINYRFQFVVSAYQ